MTKRETLEQMLKDAEKLGDLTGVRLIEQKLKEIEKNEMKEGE